MTLSPFNEKLSLVAVTSGPAGGGDFQALNTLASELADDWEIIIVAHHVDPARVMELTDAIKQIPDTTLHLLEAPCNDDIARLAGLDMAIGDRILLLESDHLDPDTCKAMLKHAQDGFEVVVEHPTAEERLPFFYRVLRDLFFWFYGRVSGVHIKGPRPIGWLYSRAAAVHLLSRREAEMLLKTHDLGAAFPGMIITSGRIRPAEERPPIAHVPNPLGRAYHALNFTASVPLRAVIGLCVASAIANGAYMMYSLISRLLSDNIVPGWTSLSLQISGVFLIISVILGIIAEHLIEVDRAVNKRPRYHVLREVRSPLSKARLGRNVVGVL